MRQRERARLGSDGQAAQPACRNVRRDGRNATEHRTDIATAQHRSDRLGTALVGHVGCVDTSFLLEKKHLQMLVAADTRRREIQLARVALAERHEFLDRIDWQRRVNHQDRMLNRNRRDRYQVTQRIEGQIRELALKHHDVVRGTHVERVTIRRGTDGGAHADNPVSAHAVFNDNCLAPPLAEFLRYEPRE